MGYLRLMSYWAAMLLVCLPLLLADSSRSRGLRSSSTSSNTKPPQYDGSVTQDIVRIYTKLKISMDYVKLATSSEKMSWFRSDITNWLRSVVSDPTYIQGTGVDSVTASSGSVVLVGFIQFRPGTPLSVIQLTTSSLTADTATLYSASHLTTVWGPLIGSTVAQNAADLMDISSVPLDTQLRTQPAAPYEADNTINSAAEGSISAQSTEQDTSTADTKRGGSRVILGGGAIAGITIAGVFIITLSGFVLARTLADKDRKKHDTDISAKLDYITELREGDLDGPEDQHQPGDVAQQGCRSGSAGHSSLWSWLRKADTPKPSQSQIAAKVTRSAAVSRASTLTTHGSGCCIAATPNSAVMGHEPRHNSTADSDAALLPLPEDKIRTLANAGKQATASSATAGTPALSTVPAVATVMDSIQGAVQRSCSTDIPAAVPAPASLRLRRTSSASAASNSSSGGRSSAGGAAGI